MAETRETEILLKVVVDRDNKKVVFAEAGSDFVDILSSFLTLPMGTIVRLVANRSDQPVNIGSFNNLYASVANLDAKYFETKECKDMLLNTRNSAEALCRNLKIDVGDMKPIQYFICQDECIAKLVGKNRAHMSTSSADKCKDCGRSLNRKIRFTAIPSEWNDGVFVTKNSSFVITDDLQVIPDNPGSTLGILVSSGIKDFAVLEDYTLKLRTNEILDLLQCSFLSKTPLSDIFFGKKCISSPFSTIQCKTDLECTDVKMTVKVFVQKSSNKILLAHSSKDFVDFLFSLLAIPIGKVFSLINRDHESPLSIENIHRSILELNVGENLKSEELKNLLLSPKLAMNYLSSNHIFPLEEETYIWDKTAGGLYNRLLDFNSRLLEFTLQSRMGAGGFIAELTKFMVTDDLVVTPLSSIPCFRYLNRLKVTPSDIEEQVVDIGIKEALNLLMAYLKSTSVLTNGLKFLVLKNMKQEASPNKIESERLLKIPKRSEMVVASC